MITDQEMDIVRRMVHYHDNVKKCYRNIMFGMTTAAGSGAIGFETMSSDNSAISMMAYTVTALSLIYSGVQFASAYNSKKNKERLNKQLQKLKSTSIDGVIKE